MATTPNMDLLLPVVTITPGPTYASENNNAFVVIDAHDHTPGKGVPIPTNGLNINNDLPFNGFNAATLRSTQFISQSTPLILPTDINSIYVSSGNLFYNNNLGQAVQITSGSSLNASTIGGIGGDYVTSGALVFYTSGTKTFTFWSSTNIPANLDSGSITIRPIATSPAGVTLSASSSLVTSYGLTLPLALPTSPAALVSDASGNVSFAVGGQMPSGAILAYGGVTPPTGYLICDGSAISRTTFATLFTAIGTSFGIGDGSTTFNIPQTQGIFLRGVDNGAGNDPDTLTRTSTNGGNSGDNIGSFQEDAYMDHTHLIPTAFGSGGTDNYVFAAGSVGTERSTALSTPAFSPGGTSSESRPKNVYINYIIKT